MLTALLSFFGGNVFRMFFGEVVSMLNKAQEHKQELERLQFQNKADADQHARNMESINTQAKLGIETIRVQADSNIAQIDAQSFQEAVKATAIKSGIPWVDGWNSVIRPAVASWSIIMITLNEFSVVTLSETTLAIAGAALGIYLATRDLFKRGK
jgi:stage V sporulation protein SpoVS